MIAHLLLIVTLGTLGLSAAPAPRDKPLSVLIIGGGPTGLATAIEAHNTGASVVVVEKRENYSRPQQLFLLDETISLLSKWEVTPPDLQTIELDDDRIGFVAINDLEESLAKKVHELGIPTIRGTFQSSSDGYVTITTLSKETLALPYDILVAADGARSEVKEDFNVETTIFGRGVGAFAFLYDPNDTSTTVDITPAIPNQRGYIRKIQAPTARLILVHNHDRASQSDMQQMAQEIDWDEEARKIGQGDGIIFADIPITLQQASTFSLPEKSLLIVGDAAATASFFQGMGANTALKTAEHAGTFFRQLQRDPSQAYERFQQSMRETTDAMLSDSALLFKRD